MSHEATMKSPLALPRPDGQVETQAPLQMAFMAPRLQGDFFPDGRLELALWGCGRMANLQIDAWPGPFVHAPNRITAGMKGLYVAQSRPALLLRGARLRMVRPARRCAWWGTLTQPIKVEPRGDRRLAKTPWGITIVEQRGDELVVAAGASEDEATLALGLSAEEIIGECNAHVARCDILSHAEPMLRSMAMQSAHASLSSIRLGEDGRFLGLAAGHAYSAPTRTYFRDGYWTLQALLYLSPKAVRDEIDLLAKGIQPDGEAPSGVILTGPAQGLEWEKYRTTNTVYKEEHLRPTDWWSDHFDSPLYFILAIGDYVRITGDRSAFTDHARIVDAIYRRYRRFDREGNGLPMKPRNDRDWADNVYRHGYVAYNIGLWIGALDVLAALADGDLAAEAKVVAGQARANLDAALLTDGGWYADYGIKGDFLEDHLALDSLTLLRFNAVSAERAKIILDRVQSTLETRNNRKQPYGDWGVMCAWPPFKRPADIRAKSAFPYRYHNGSDWPYLSAIYAEQRLQYGLDGWDYPLLRWWKTSLDKGWIGSVEYFAPPFGRGSLLQGWTGMHAATILRFADRMVPGPTRQED